MVRRGVIFSILAFSGWVIGVCKHWILWGVVILGINIGLLAWFLLYALPRMKFTIF